MVDHQASPRYQSYLLRFWQERGGPGTESPVWRFSLEDPHSRIRHGYATLDELVAAILRDMDSTQQDPMQTERYSEDEAASRRII